MIGQCDGIRNNADADCLFWCLQERHQKDVLEVQMLDANERVKNAQKAADKYSNAFKEQSKLQVRCPGLMENLTRFETESL